MVGTFPFNFKHRERPGGPGVNDRWADKLVCAGNIWNYLAKVGHAI
jgi:hypothetical protein